MNLQGMACKLHTVRRHRCIDGQAMYQGHSERGSRDLAGILQPRVASTLPPRAAGNFKEGRCNRCCGWKHVALCLWAGNAPGR